MQSVPRCVDKKLLCSSVRLTNVSLSALLTCAQKLILHLFGVFLRGSENTTRDFVQVSAEMSGQEPGTTPCTLRCDRARRHRRLCYPGNLTASRTASGCHLDMPLYRVHSRMLAVSAFACENFANLDCPISDAAAGQSITSCVAVQTAQH